MDDSPIVSVISEIELLGWHKITDNDKRLLRSLLDDCIIFELTADIRKIAIQIRQQAKVKTPDAIVAATSKYLQVPLVTTDTDFRKILGLELILL